MRERRFTISKTRMSYEDIGDWIRDNEEYKAHSSHAIYVDGIYSVFSYDTLIYSLNVKTGEYYFNGNWISKTTSTLQNVVRLVKNARSNFERQVEHELSTA